MSDKLVRRGWRVRWAAIGAAVAVAVGAGGIGYAGANLTSSSALTFNPVNPCRLADTRADRAVGPRTSPLGPDETVTFQATETSSATITNHRCDSLPPTAAALVLNVTAVGATETSYLTLWPADASRPTASHLNYQGGDGPRPNAVTVDLSPTGAFNAFNKNGTVELIIDVVGYYADHDHDGRYYTETETNGLLAGKSNTGHLHDERYYTETETNGLLAGKSNTGHLHDQRYYTQSEVDRIAEDPATDAEQRRIAEDRWWTTSDTFLVGDNLNEGALGGVYDGRDLWVTNVNTSTITRMSLDGEILGVHPAGSTPFRAVFDGSHIWVTNIGPDTVTKLDLEGAIVGTSPVGATPQGLGFDGSHIWVANGSGSTVTKLDLDGTTVGTYPVGPDPLDIAFDGEHIWVARGNNMLEKLTTDGASLATYPVGGTAVIFDGTFIWSTSLGDDSLTRMLPDGTDVQTIPVGNFPLDLAFDGTDVWVVNYDDDTMVRVQSGTGPVLLEAHPVGDGPYAVISDGTHMWSMNDKSSDVTRILRP